MSAFNFTRVQKTRSHSGVVDQIKRLIDAGELRPGDRLPAERELALKFSVSRVTLREAFRVLELMGVVEARQGKGRFVVERKHPEDGRVTTSEALEEATLFDFLEVRKAIEVGMAGLAAERASDEDLTAMQAALEAEEKKALGLAFDLALARATRNSVYEKFFSSQAFLVYRLATMTALLPTRYPHSFREHQDIFDAIRRHDPEGARSAMQRHLNNIHHRLQHALSQRSVKVGDFSGE